MYNIKSMTLDKYEMSFGVDFRMRQRGPVQAICVECENKTFLVRHLIELLSCACVFRHNVNVKLEACPHFQRLIVGVHTLACFYGSMDFLGGITVADLDVVGR